MSIAKLLVLSNLTIVVSMASQQLKRLKRSWHESQDSEESDCSQSTARHSKPEESRNAPNQRSRELSGGHLTASKPEESIDSSGLVSSGLEWRVMYLWPQCRGSRQCTCYIVWPQMRHCNTHCIFGSQLGVIPLCGRSWVPLESFLPVHTPLPVLCLWPHCHGSRQCTCCLVWQQMCHCDN